MLRPELLLLSTMLLLVLGEDGLASPAWLLAGFTEGISAVTTGSGYLGAFLASFLMILCAEIGDKTFFIAAVLSMKHNHVVVFLGAIGALALMTDRPQERRIDILEVHPSCVKRNCGLHKALGLYFMYVTCGVLSAALGFLLPTLLSKHFTHYTCITLFLYFGLKLLKEAYEMDGEGGENEELKEVELELKEEDDDCSQSPSPASEGVPDDCEEGPSRGRGWACSEETLFSRLAIRVFTQAFTMTFLAEWGDRSQISTIALASSKNPLGVTVGGVLGHCICNMGITGK
ncbi:hypothetical protein FOL46_009718 [Perkinsus olseni]|uniref:GDT1 family protein n=1 Tax=Perkinsus olseni TaxID=32597 RepID=A0A7J6KZ99_PEROL|nr:hypothetical protein FOL46_009718 [Perkinsus olseni]